jgi:hypothetical protein
VPPVVTSIALYGSVCFCDWFLASPTWMFGRAGVDRYIATDYHNNNYDIYDELKDIKKKHPNKCIC